MNDKVTSQEHHTNPPYQSKPQITFTNWYNARVETNIAPYADHTLITREQKVHIETNHTQRVGSHLTHYSKLHIKSKYE